MGRGIGADLVGWIILSNGIGVFHQIQNAKIFFLRFEQSLSNFILIFGHVFVKESSLQTMSDDYNDFLKEIPSVKSEFYQFWPSLSPPCSSPNEALNHEMSSVSGWWRN